MTGDLILAIDQGTTSTRAALVDEHGRRVVEVALGHRSTHPQPGHVEHDPVEILANVTACAREVLSRVDRRRLRGVGITNQRETVVLWDRATGAPLANALVWQDGRTAGRCEELAAGGASELVTDATGLPINAYFSATKIAWLLDDVPGARVRAARGELAVGTIETWLVWSLTGGADGGAHLTDATNASRTLVFNTRTLAWDERLLELFDVPRELLATVVGTASATGLAMTRADGPLGCTLPVLALLGDQQAALVGQGCFDVGQTKGTYGTGAFLLANAGPIRPVPLNGMLASVAYQPAGCAPTYCVEGSIAVAGAAISWLARLGVIDDPEAASAVAVQEESSEGVRVVPAFQGLYAPWWDGQARGAIVGLTLATTRGHVVRATIEALAFATRAVLDAASPLVGGPASGEELRVDGGATMNPVLVQTLADVLGRPVVRALDPEATVRGVAFAAGIADGLWTTGEVDSLIDRASPVVPRWSADRRDAEHASWLDAVEGVRSIHTRRSGSC